MRYWCSQPECLKFVSDVHFYAHGTVKPYHDFNGANTVEHHPVELREEPSDTEFASTTSNDQAQG